MGKMEEAKSMFDMAAVSQWMIEPGLALSVRTGMPNVIFRNISDVLK